MLDQKAARRIVDILTGTWRSQALYAAVSFGIPDHVAAGHVTDEELAARTQASLDGIRRLMRLLTALDVVERDGSTGNADGGYRLTPVGELLRADSPHSMRDMIQIYGEEFYRAWGAIVPAIRTGTAGFQHVFGKTLHEYVREPRAGERFQRAMNAGNVFFLDVLEIIDFGRWRTVVDVAGGSGTLLGMILQAYPGLRGILFDQPHVVPGADAHLAEAVGPGRYEVRAGDIFESVPDGADAYLLSRVLQDWNDERCVKLLSNIRAAMAEPGSLLILERVITEDGGQLLPLLYDLHLHIVAGGQERDLAGYRALLSAAGLRLEAVHSLSLQTSLLVATAE